METNSPVNLIGNNDAERVTSGNFAEHVGTAAGHVLDVTKAAGKQIGVVAQEEMINFKADLNDLISRVPHLTEIELKAAKEKLLAKFQDAKATARNVTADASRQFDRGVELTGDYVKQRPIQSVALAAGIGVILGMLISRR